MSAIASLFERASLEDRRVLRFCFAYPRRLAHADRSAVARIFPRLSLADRVAAERAVRAYARFVETTDTPARLVPWASWWLSDGLYREDWAARKEPARDLGRCRFNFGGQYVNAGQCHDRATVIDPRSGAMYCARHARSQWLKVSARAAA